MQVPSMLEGESLKRLLQGAAAGAVATIFVGFYWGGWSLGSTADKTAKERSELAVVAALKQIAAVKAMVSNNRAGSKASSAIIFTFTV
jgi:hypothetical protein